LKTHRTLTSPRHRPTIGASPSMRGRPTRVSVAKGVAMTKKGNGIFLVFTDVDPKHEEEFNAWYDTEHLGDLLKLPGFLDAGRYVAAKGGPKYLAVYELASADALKSAEFQRYRANPSPWSRRMSPTVIGKNLARGLGAGRRADARGHAPRAGIAGSVPADLPLARPRQVGVRPLSERVQGRRDAQGHLIRLWLRAGGRRLYGGWDPE